jgi:tetratricopeptide (TPR) repeat protein
VCRIFARSALLLFLGSALLLVIRLAIAEADFRRNPAHALLTPLWLRAANLAQYESSPEELRAAVTLNPRLSSAWIHLGLDAEADGNLSEAEVDLLQAAHVDRQYLPAWTLANFYFRRGDAEDFWPWAARAAALTYDDYRPLLRLADALDSSPQNVATRLGGGAPLLRAYLDLLIGMQRLDAAQEIASLLSARHDPSDRARLADFADRVSRAH